MTGPLDRIVAVLGGDLWDRGRCANVPAPGHSRADRSVSLRVVDGRLLIHGFGRADWRVVRDDLVRRGLVGADGRLDAPSGVSRGLRSPADRQRAVERLWSALVPVVSADLAGLHLRRRAVDLAPEALDDLRFGRAPLSAYRTGGPDRPVLAAAIRAEGRLTALELTYLDADGARARRLRLARKTVGRLPPGCAVALSPAATRMVVGEGVFTVLSAMSRFERPGHALLAARNLARWSPPPIVRDVLIAADPGPVGEAAAEVLAGRLTARDIRVGIRLPPSPHVDWNALAVAEAEGREAAGVGGDGDGPRRPTGSAP